MTEIITRNWHSILLQLVLSLGILVQYTHTFLISDKPPTHVSLNLAKKSLQNSRELMKKVDQYIKIRDLKRQGNFTQAELLEYSQQMTSSEEKGYRKFVGKGTLDQRLRAIISYKRENNAYIEESLQDMMSVSESQDLESVMEDDEDYDLPEDDIDLTYDREIQRILEMNALEEVKRNMIQDPDANSGSTEDSAEAPASSADVSSLPPAAMTESSAVRKPEINESDYYTPKSSSWGLFPRPRDISKAYGGGRVITREEMLRRQEEYEKESFKVIRLWSL